MVKYIYASYSKCGTKTMAKAFRTLGFTVCDFYENFYQEGDLWYQILAKNGLTEKEKLDLIYQALYKYDVCMDIPTFMFFFEIIGFKSLKFKSIFSYDCQVN